MAGPHVFACNGESGAGNFGSVNGAFRQPQRQGDRYNTATGSHFHDRLSLQAFGEADSSLDEEARLGSRQQGVRRYAKTQSCEIAIAEVKRYWDRALQFQISLNETFFMAR